MDMDPRRPVRHNARMLHPGKARDLFDALCEEFADAVLHDVPEAVWRVLLPLLSPQGMGECPYPREGAQQKDMGDAPPGGLVLLTEGAPAAEAASLQCSRAAASLDPILWADILSALLPMLEAVRDRNRVLLIEA